MKIYNIYHIHIAQWFGWNPRLYYTIRRVRINLLHVYDYISYIGRVCIGWFTYIFYHIFAKKEWVLDYQYCWLGEKNKTPWHPHRYIKRMYHHKNYFWILAHFYLPCICKDSMTLSWTVHITCIGSVDKTTILLPIVPTGVKTEVPLTWKSEYTEIQCYFVQCVVTEETCGCGINVFTYTSLS